jgi:phage shock protein PspC (stress-responsive transcriptional regulator)
MKKIININLSGRVIPIEDSAYEKLQSYIESLRRYFVKEEGRDEIINDIESRIAELMNEKIRLGSSAITDEDVNGIIKSMGRPEDFEAAENETMGASAGTSSSYSQSKANTDYSYTRNKKRLYRDTGDKMLGGVCSGLANYINIDTSIVRLLFAIITFGGFGFGVLVYIILWIVLPARDLDQVAGKRLYRNPEERVLGGVASGLAAYFNKETWLIRLLFAAPLILNIFFGILSWPFFHEGSFVPNIIFGSLTGTFILAYIILWIVLPEAKSQYQQMEMRGETVDVNTIRQNVKEGMVNMKGRMQEWGQEVKESAQNLSGKAKEFANTRGRSFANEAGEAARRTGRGLGHVIGVIFKAFFLFIAGTIAFGLFVALMGLIFGGIGIWPLKNFILDGFWQNAFAWGTLVLFLGVPLIGFMTWLLRRIMRVRRSGSYLGWTFGGLWTLGWICAALLAASLVNDFRMSNHLKRGTDLTITQPANGRLIVTVTEPEVEYSGTIPWIDIDGKGIDVTNDTLKLANVRVRVEQSDDSAYHVEVKKYSRGQNVPDAEKKAQQIQFNISYADSILDVGSGIAISKDSKFRDQQVVVIVRVPVGKKIRFDETLDKFHALNIRVREHSGRRWSKDFDIDMDEYFDYETNVDYVMAENGALINPDRPVIDNNDKNDTSDKSGYRYQNKDSTGNDIQKQLQREKQKRDESERKIKELEKKEKEQKPTTSIQESMDNEDGAITSSPSPLFSLVKSVF